MKLMKEEYIDYIYRGHEYKTKPLILKKIVKQVMNTMPIIKSTAMYSDELEKHPDAWEKKYFEKKVIEYINKHKVEHGELTEQTIIPTNNINWKGLINAINTGFYQIEQKDFRWRTHKKKRIRIAYDGVTPPQIFHGLETESILKEQPRIKKQIDRVQEYENQTGLKPKFKNEQIRYINAIEKKLIEEK